MAKFSHIILFSLIMIFPYQSAESYQSIENVTLEDAKAFPGNWSLAPEEAYLALKYCEYQDVMTVLEFGAGASTVELTKLFDLKNITYDYHVFEHDPKFFRDIKNVFFYFYNLPAVDYSLLSPVIRAIKLPELPVFDLVIVDGPHGVARSEWYAKFKKYTRPGTIILIDDFHHFKEFGESLDENFAYTTIIEYNQSYVWKIINEGLETIDHRIVPKCFKIVIVDKIL